MQDVKMQDVKMTDQVARHENAGHENDGPIKLQDVKSRYGLQIRITSKI